MKKTIKEDRARKIIKEEYLDDNTLLEVTVEEGLVIVAVRYVESPIYGIREITLFRTSVEQYMKHMENLMMISEDKAAIATFRPTEHGYMLRDVFETEDHGFVPSDFVDIAFRKSFPQKLLTKHFTLDTSSSKE